MALPSTRLQWDVRQDDLVRYAGAARDFNAIHYDPMAAAEAGYERPIAQGMLTLGRLVAGVLGENGPGGLTAIACRFTGPALVGTHLVAELTEEVTGVGATLGAVVADTAGQRVLTATMSFGERACGSAHRPATGPAAVGDLAAEYTLIVERGPAARFAETLGAANGVFTDPSGAAAHGYAAIPVFPTFAFALPGWGWFAGESGNARGDVPDAVRDCRRWAGTVDAVVHAGQRFVFSRPLYVGETVLATTRVTGHSTKNTPSRVLRFTDVATVFTDEHHHHVLTSTMSLVVADRSNQEER